MRWEIDTLQSCSGETCPLSLWSFRRLPGLCGPPQGAGQATLYRSLALPPPPPSLSLFLSPCLALFLHPSLPPSPSSQSLPFIRPPSRSGRVYPCLCTPPQGTSQASNTSTDPPRGPPPCRSPTPLPQPLFVRRVRLLPLSLSPSLSPPPFPLIPPDTGLNTWRAPGGGFTPSGTASMVSGPSRGPRRVLNSGASSPGPQLDAPLFRTQLGPREGPQSRRRV